MGLIVATKAFFKLLVNRELSDSFQQLLDGKLAPRISSTPPAETKTSKQKQQESPAAPIRSDAISLLAALQREARLVDLIQESLDNYTDAQIGAAARDVLANSSAVLDRMLALKPLTDTLEGNRLTTSGEFDPAEYRLTGNVAGQPPFTGTVAHRGWTATRCEIPQWNGQPAAAKIVAPIELEV